MSSADHSQLGKATPYVEHYDPSQLFPIPRAGKREELGLVGVMPFHGVDIWNAYELSWLDAKGKPRVALAEFRVPATSPNIIESKSFKLYLNSFAQTRLHDDEELLARMVSDLSAATGAGVQVQMVSARDFATQRVDELAGELIDDLDISIDNYGPPRPDWLAADDATEVEETLVSHLLKSNSPVTGQPDWARVQIRYAGPRSDRAGLLRY